jgi:RHS repeat-associated protein
MTSEGSNLFTWNARDQLVSMNSGASSFGYDPIGRRAAKTVSGATTNYLYDGVNIVQELQGGTPAANLLSGGIDEVFSRTDAAGARSLLADALGSTLALVDSAGTIHTQYTYEPFGNTTVTGAPSTNSYQYTGRENDGTGPYYYRARYYDPSVGRFLSEDPRGFIRDINLYAYVGNAPTILIDPFGLQGGPWHPPAGVHTKCLPSDDCWTIEGKMWILKRTIDSHTGWDRTMPRPRGGNRHADEIAQLWTQYAECQELYEKKCKDCDKKEGPGPDFVPNPAPGRKRDRGPMGVPQLSPQATASLLGLLALWALIIALSPAGL